MNRKSKKIIIIISFMMIIGLVCGCGASDPESEKIQSKEGLDIVVTIFPEYDWVRNIVGDESGAEITLLLDNGVDLHSYQPSAEDIVRIKECDVFIYIGGESAAWVDEVLKEVNNEDMEVIDILEVLEDKVKKEEVVEGMEPEEDTEMEAEDDEAESDEHVWLSLRNAALICDEIATRIENKDKDNADLYSKNVEAYKEELIALDKEYAEAVSAGTKDTLLFADRFPFRYLVDDYGLDYYAAFSGCSAETEASFETVVFLAKKVDELGLHSIMTIEGPNYSIAETVRDTTGSKDQQILTIDSMQSTTASDIEAGTTYISIMRKNLEVLKEALK